MDEIPTPSEVISKKERTRDHYRAMYAIATGGARVKRSEDIEKAKPDTRLDLIDYYDQEGELDYFVCREHIDHSEMLRNAYYYNRVQLKDIKFKYWREGFVTYNKRSVTQMIFCNLNDKGARPVTVGYV